MKEEKNRERKEKKRLEKLTIPFPLLYDGYFRYLDSGVYKGGRRNIPPDISYGPPGVINTGMWE